MHSIHLSERTELCDILGSLLVVQQEEGQDAN